MTTAASYAYRAFATESPVTDHISLDSLMAEVKQLHQKIDKTSESRPVHSRLVQPLTILRCRPATYRLSCHDRSSTTPQPAQSSTPTSHLVRRKDLAMCAIQPDTWPAHVLTAMNSLMPPSQSQPMKVDLTLTHHRTMSTLWQPLAYIPDSV